MWWANQKIRHERECVCDDAVLRFGQCTPESYGETIVQVLTAARGRSLVTGNMVGIFERGNHLQNRMEEIMSFAVNKKRFGWMSRAAVLLFAALFLPMAPQAGVSEEVATGIAVAEAPTALSQERWPQVIATSPQIGETGVATSVNEITVTFDRDMQTGMSWTGGPPQFPADESRKAQWKDKRTCVLPVKLVRGKIYRVGINSASFNNFKSEDGEPALHRAIFFTTEGASRSVERQVQVPQIVELEPANHAGDVDPKTRTLRVTFDMPMGGGMSWTGGGSDFPKIDASRKSRWSKNGRTCILPVTLEPGHTYKLGLNSLHHINFQSKWGVPPVPVVYEFSTSGNSEQAAERTGQDIDPTTARVRGLVEVFFQNNFRDIKQRRTIEWGPITKNGEGEVSIRYKYHTKIWDKEAQVMNQIFTFRPNGEFVNWSHVEGSPEKAGVASTK